MIQFNARIQELLQQPVLQTFHCIQLHNFRFTSHDHNLTLPDGVYISTDVISVLENLRATSTVDRDLYKITLADPSFTMLSFYEGGAVGKVATVRLGFVDYETQEPDTQNTIIIYKGVIESFDYQVDTAEQGQVISEIRCSNPMADLDGVRPFYTSKDFIRQLSADDTAFDQVYSGAGSVSLKWGKR